LYKIHQLDKEIARNNAKDLLRLHNMIPHQYWELEDLLAERDTNRTFNRKWLLSRVALHGHLTLGMCIAFEDGDTTPNTPFIYVHRLVVLPTLRRKGIGSALLLDLGRLLSTNTISVYGDIVVQTPLSIEQEPTNIPLAFYKALGFSVTGRKQYKTRIDLILRTTAHNLVVHHNKPR
jgi:GNAT superfamily N-acetyltransferase